MRCACTPTFNAIVAYYNLLLFPRELEVWFGSYSRIYAAYIVALAWYIRLLLWPFGCIVRVG